MKTKTTTTTAAPGRDPYSPMTDRNAPAPVAPVADAPARAAFEAEFNRAHRRTPLGNPRLNQHRQLTLDRIKAMPEASTKLLEAAADLFKRYADATDLQLQHAASAGTIDIMGEGPARPAPTPVMAAPSQAATALRDGMQRRGFRFAIEGDKLAVGPAHALTADDRRRIADLREPLLSRLMEERELF